MRALYYKFLYIFYNFYFRFTADKLRVLAYHGVEDKEKFDAQLVFLKKNFSIIDVEILKEYIFNSRKLPKNPLLITFDDGDISVLKNGLPLLQKYGFPAIMFVVTDLINSQKPYWWEEIRYFLPNGEGDKKSWEVKNWENHEREEYLEKLRKETKKPPLTRIQLSFDQLNLMKRNDMLIANHTHTHPMLDKCTKSKIEEEIETSSSILESLNFANDVFAYPNGNFDQKVENILKEKGIKLAFLFDHKINSKKINPLRISRIRVDSDIDLVEFKVKVSGLHSLIYHKFTKKRN